MAELSETQLNEMIDSAVQEHDNTMKMKYDKPPAQEETPQPAQAEVAVAKMETPSAVESADAPSTEATVDAPSAVVEAIDTDEAPTARRGRRRRSRRSKGRKKKKRSRSRGSRRCRSRTGRYKKCSSRRR